VKIVSLWAASRPVLRDLITSVRLIGFDPEGETWAWWDLDDGVPAMGAIPTLKWIGGSYVRDPRWSTVATSADPGQDLAAVLRVYDSFSGQPLAILDKDIASANPWVPMGTTTVGR